MPSSLVRLYDEHADALFAFLLTFTRSEADAKDALQEVFTKLARRPELLEGIREQRAFLLRLTHRAALDLFRRQATRTRHEAQCASEAMIFDSAEQADESAFREAVSVALAQLPAEQRAVVHLKLWEGLTFKAAAEVLGVSQDTAASRYRYGLDKLRGLLRPLYRELL